MRSIRPAAILVICSALIFAGGLLTGRLRAQQSGASVSPYYVTTFVDLIPARRWSKNTWTPHAKSPATRPRWR